MQKPTRLAGYAT